MDWIDTLDLDEAANPVLLGTTVVTENTAVIYIYIQCMYICIRTCVSVFVYKTKNSTAIKG